jgi:hypothetical protein
VGADASVPDLIGAIRTCIDAYKVQSQTTLTSGRQPSSASRLRSVDEMTGRCGMALAIASTARNE